MVWLKGIFLSETLSYVFLGGGVKYCNSIDYIAAVAAVGILAVASMGDGLFRVCKSVNQ